ncbi:hypothetical protein [Engelhardtia mirabilis]|uniref:Uncharacterized protein n=1 Tax=Engelhardtia mirabilis TaxID=2528011 RepID=A0A518BPF5_9BACT|nr:hypothetical protein Pla133_39740 [Planctomycetes bacterium Pla133]QDV03191.1 hypothetical protein Pla86_39730 [Planctomycetes bacterium Pla86]
MQPAHLIGLALSSLVLTSCVTTGEGLVESSEGVPPPPRLTTGPWTDSFNDESVLIAEVIEISGPDRLAQQFVARQDPGNVDFEIKTVSQGLWQEYRVVQPGAVIEAQLDAWKLVATKRLVVLQRPGRVDVQLRADGDAFFQRTADAQPQRGPRFEHHAAVPWGP